jgi:hypothetical protein
MGGLSPLGCVELNGGKITYAGKTDNLPISFFLAAEYGRLFSINLR